LAKEYLVKDGGVVAVDIAGAEALFKTEKYEELFRKT
jgi:adenosine deaminase